MHRPLARLFGVVFFAFLAACQGRERSGAAPASGAGGRPGAAAAPLVPPSQEEARQYAEQFIEAVSKPNVARASMMIDWDMLLDRALANTSGPKRFRDGFIRGAKENTQMSAYVQQMANLVQSGATMSLLRVRESDGERRALLRILLPQGGVTYNEMLLTRDDKGFVRAADVYAYGGGEYISAAMRRLYLAAIAAEPSAMERLAGKENQWLDTARLYKELGEKVLAGKNEEVVALVKRMPPEVRKEKNVLVAYVSASSSLDAAQYQAAIDELRRTFPNDAGIELMLIDGYYLKKRYDEAIASIDRLDQSLGGDAYLDVLRSTMYVEKGDLDAANQSALRATVREPSLADGHWALVTVSLARKDFDETARVLTHIRDKLNIEIADLTAIPQYAEFVRSDAYRRWQQ